MDYKSIVSLIEKLPGHVYLKDRTGVILACSREQLEMIGTQHTGPVIGKTVFDFLDKKEAERIHHNDLKVINTGTAITVEEESTYNGKKITMLTCKSPFRDDKDNIIGVIGYTINITEQKDLYKQLINENYRNKIALDNVISNLPGHIYWKDEAGVILGCNDKQARFIGFQDTKQVVGKTEFDFISKPIAEKMRKHDLHIMQTGIAEILEETVTVEGKNHTFVSHKAPLKDPATGEVLGIIGVSVDITKQKELEHAYKKKALELTQALEVKDAFLNNMSHEVRTPLQGIIGMADVLESAWDTLSDEKKRNCVKSILEARDRLMNLLSNLLDLSKLRQGRAAFEFKYHDIKLLILDVITEFQYITQPIDLCIAAGVDVHICCDDWRLKQVIRNMIANSVKHGGQDKLITITLTTHTHNNKKYLKIAVQDEGMGVPEDELEAIFDPFYESTRTKRTSGGTGIGLALCKDIIDAHKGTMWAENNKTVGSTFYVTLPYEEQSQQVYTFRLTRKS